MVVKCRVWSSFAFGFLRVHLVSVLALFRLGLGSSYGWFEVKCGFRQGLLEGWPRVSVGFVLGLCRFGLGFMDAWFRVSVCLVQG